MTNVRLWYRAFWTGCLLVVTGLLITAADPPHPIELGPQRTVTTINPKMGLHTRLTDERSEEHTSELQSH